MRLRYALAFSPIQLLLWFTATAILEQGTCGSGFICRIIGRKAGPEAIRRAAIQAEELGFADFWSSEHIVIPKGALGDLL